MRTMKILITGKPRSGKSTLINRLIHWLQERSVQIGGIQTPELREGRRVGFEIIDLSSKARGILSHVNIKSIVKVSKYGVNLHAIREIGVPALLTALSDRDFIIMLTPVLKREQSYRGGWRWHKWGPYIGKEQITTEYLYDEEKVQGVFCFQIYERKKNE